MVRGRSYKVHVIDYVEISGSIKYFSEVKTNLGTFGAALFTEQTEITLPSFYIGFTAWADYDNDSYLDVLLSGFSSNGPKSAIYRNNGSTENGFTEQISFSGLYYSSGAFGDYDMDGDLDIVLTGTERLNETENPVSKLYRNNGNNSFTEQTSISIKEVSYGSVAWGDYDNDGDLDLLLTGSGISKIYRNNYPVNSFTEQNDITIIGVDYSSVAWGDYDNDGDLDFILTGAGLSKIYKNNYPENSFTIQNDILLAGISHGSVAWGDYNNDGNLDLLLTGYDPSSGAVSKIYRNNGNNTFTVQTDIEITNVCKSSVAWGDYDNDGDLDILLTGEGNVSKIYRNNYPLNSFTEQIDVSLFAVQSGSVAWGDYDNDGDLDIIIFGVNKEFSISKIYNNNLFMKAGSYYANQKPTAPYNLNDVKIVGGYRLSWDGPIEDETPLNGLSYNIAIGKDTNKLFLAAPSNIDTIRMISALGNCGSNRFYNAKLPVGKYYWKVQAVDGSFKGGDWSAIDSFEIRNTIALFSADTVCFGEATSFANYSSATDSILYYKWFFGDGSTEVVKEPTHIYARSGNYDVKLIVTSRSGEKDSTEKRVYVKPKPLANFQSNVVCHGDPTVLVNQTDENELTISCWKWSFGDNQTYNQKTPDPHYYSQSGEYTAKLVATSDNGCSDSITQPVIVAKYPVVIVFANGPVEFCEGENVLLSVEKNDVYNYQWKLNGIALSDSNHFHCGANYKGNYSVDVENTLAGCLSSSSAVNVNVVEKPVKPVINVSGFNPNNCPEYELITMEVEESTALYSYQWKRNGVPLSNETQPIFNGYLQEGIYTVDVASGDCKISSDGINIGFNYEIPEKPDIVAHGPNIWYLACTDTTAALYKWYYNNTLIEGATRSVYVANQNLGEYKVSINISAQGNCWVTSDPLTIPIVTTGVDDPDPFANVKIYPNPTPGVFTIEMENQVYGDLNIKIANSEVREILSIKFNKTTEHFSTQIDLSGQAKGLYIINLLIEKYKASRKLVVE